KLTADENGNWVETYLKLEMGRKQKLTDDNYARAQKDFARFVARNLDIAPEMVRPISAEEYFAKVGEDKN
ncbi:MAG: hypothetical protein QXI12_12145, partial [Candidatus Methanomethyliaceae archaeon]